MDWNAVTAALAGAVASAVAAIVWSAIDRRRATTDALVGDAYAAFERLSKRVSMSRQSLLPRWRGRTWLAELIDAESARTRLTIHLGARRWRSKRLGLRETLRAEQVRMWHTATQHAANDTDESRAALLKECDLARATLGRWVAHRRSFWRGDISDEIRSTLNSNRHSQPRGPRWWRQIRPGKSSA